MLNLHTNRGSITGAGLAAIAGTAASLAVSAQSARLTGHVIDQAGVIVTRPNVSLTNRTTGERVAMVGDDEGRFEFADLEPGIYSLVASTPGYERLFRRVALAAGAAVDETLTFRIGSLEETITVTDTGGSPPAAREATPADRARYRQRLAVYMARHADGGATIFPPVKTRDVTPVYPPSMRGSGVEGRVVIEAVLTTDGTADVTRILSPLDPETLEALHPDFARAAVDGVAGWRYTPTLLHGEQVDVRMTITITFLP